MVRRKYFKPFNKRKPTSRAKRKAYEKEYSQRPEVKERNIERSKLYYIQNKEQILTKQKEKYRRNKLTPEERLEEDLDKLAKEFGYGK